jgi:RES domain
MSSTISTREELSSNSRHSASRSWRVVEAQHIISTAKLTDTAEEQRILENLIEGTKPNIPPECQHFNYLLSTPFRYGAPYPRGSRFRGAGRTLGVFYSSENVDTAIAEMCFCRLLLFAESPATKWPTDAGEFTAFAVEYATPRSIDLTRPPFDDRAAIWMHPTQYDGCQELAELARSVDIEIIKYASARDPSHKLNAALLTCRAFARAEPADRQTWRILLGSNGARALCEMPRIEVDFDRTAFHKDPRIAVMRWDR